MIKMMEMAKRTEITMRPIIFLLIIAVTFSNETRGLSFLSFCGIEIFGKMAIVVRYELINPVRQKRDICLRSVNGAKSKMAKQSPVEIIAIVRPGII